MTILGPDISSYEDGLDVADLPHPFVLAKCTEGTYYVDKDYPAWRDQAHNAGKVFVAYHFISGEGPAAQARHLATHIGDLGIPVMLDWEPTTGYSPDLPQLLAVADAMKRAGLLVRLAYVPRWHWATLGNPPPSLTGLGARGISLVSSAYPGGAAYPGDKAAGWTPYGGMTPALYQFTNKAQVGGKSVDMNAFRGTIEQLQAVLGLSTPAHQENTDMAKIPPSISQKWPELAADFPPNAEYTDEAAIIWGDAGSRAAALYARQARDAVLALIAKGTPAAAPVDVDALAAALLPKLENAAATGLTSDQLAQLADELAHASIVHLADALKAGAGQ